MANNRGDGGEIRDLDPLLKISGLKWKTASALTRSLTFVGRGFHFPRKRFPPYRSIGRTSWQGIYDHSPSRISNSDRCERLSAYLSGDNVTRRPQIGGKLETNQKPFHKMVRPRELLLISHHLNIRSLVYFWGGSHRGFDWYRFAAEPLIRYGMSHVR